MTDTTSNNKRIAKNTLMLYFRMLLSMGVSLYTSRVVLNTLGVEDYGIYGVVGGVVSMFSFLNASMSGATSRFLTYEIGRKNTQRLKETFSSALIIHIGIAIIILLLAETIGLWFLNNKLVIPEERMYAANWVFQLSILSMIINVTQVPYNASIISHEKMDIYAYVEIANVILKLLIVYLLTIGNFDKLILYATLLLGVCIIIALTYRIYCIKYFKECRFKWIYKSSILKPMLSFSVWDLYINLALTGRNQGINMIINIFFGAIANAAANIAITIQGILGNFGENILTATKPQIIKSYAYNNLYEMERILILSSTLGTICMGIVSIPMLLECKYVIYLWLNQVPQHSEIICQLSLTFSIIYFLFRPITFAIHATGQIKWMGIINGSIYLLVLPLTYFILKYKYLNIEVPYVLNLVLLILAYGVINLILLKKYIPQFNIKNYLYSVGKVILILCLSFVITYYAKEIMNESLIRIIALTSINFICITTSSYLFLLDKNTRIFINQKIKKIFLSKQ